MIKENGNARLITIGRLIPDSTIFEEGVITARDMDGDCRVERINVPNDVDLECLASARVVNRILRENTACQNDHLISGYF